tara:strand:- start:318 stop:515 length:198 start_codon:yes stop_codon:yes gene_type:complete
MKEIKVIIADDVLSSLKNALVVAGLSGRGLSLNEHFMDGLLTRIKEGKKETTFEFNKDKTNGKTS